MNPAKSLILAFTLLTLTILSCGNTEKILPKNGGLWNITQLQIDYQNPAIADTTILDYGTFEFRDDGTGDVTFSNPLSTAGFDWAIISEGAQIQIAYYCTFCSFIFDIAESSKKSQKWITTIVDYPHYDSTESVDLIYDLEKAE